MDKNHFSRKYIDTFIKNKGEYEKVLHEMSDRVDYILKYIFGCRTMRWWNWTYESYDNRCNMPIISDGFVDFYVDFCRDKYVCSKFIVDKDGKIVDIHNKIPLRWLWEDFEKEYDDGIVKYDEQRRKNIEKEKKRLKQKVDMERGTVEKAKRKLSRKELIAIKRKILSEEYY